jgi:hypothetical protein
MTEATRSCPWAEQDSNPDRQADSSLPEFQVIPRPMFTPPRTARYRKRPMESVISMSRRRHTLVLLLSLFFSQRKKSTACYGYLWVHQATVRYLVYGEVQDDYACPLHHRCLYAHRRSMNNTTQELFHSWTNNRTQPEHSYSQK